MISPNVSDSPAVAGVQTVGRAVMLLRLIASRGAAGARLLDIAVESGLQRPTVHRLLRQLRKDRLLTQDPLTKRYHLGVLLYELGLAAPTPIRRLDRMRPLLRTLAASTEDSVYLTMRSGDEVVCLACEEGSFPIRVRTFEVGVRRPLGVGAAGLALLAALPEAEMRAMMTRNAESVKRHDLSVPQLEARVLDAHARGYALSVGTIAEGVTGLAACVPTLAGAPYLSVSVAAISSRMPQERYAALHKDITRITKQLATIQEAG